MPGPLSFVHVPVPTEGTAAREAVAVAHTPWSGPAFATGTEYTLIVYDAGIVARGIPQLSISEVSVYV